MANTFLGDVELETEDLVRGVVDSCVFIHQSVERKSKVRRCRLTDSKPVLKTPTVSALESMIW